MSDERRKHSIYVDWDRVGGQPISRTYCKYCGVSVSGDRRQFADKHGRYCKRQTVEAPEEHIEVLSRTKRLNRYEGQDWEVYVQQTHMGCDAPEGPGWEPFAASSFAGVPIVFWRRRHGGS